MIPALDPTRYPQLFDVMEATFGTTPLRFVFEAGPPPPDLISNVRFVGCRDGRYLLINTAEFGWSALPGGTLEPGESVQDALERELMEEAGARPLSFTVFGGMHFWSGAVEPYRPHLPHPEFYWVMGFGDVEIVSEPTPTADGERILDVRLVDLDEAAALLTDREGWQFEFLRLVSDIREMRA